MFFSMFVITRAMYTCDFVQFTQSINIQYNTISGGMEGGFDYRHFLTH